MTKTERDNIKQEAQVKLFLAMQVAFMKLEDMEDDDKAVLIKEMSKQMGRIERLLGWEVGSWTRGC